MNLSIVYKNIFFYRLIMQLLYKGAYMKRFTDVFGYINSKKSLTELCFGDTIIAGLCKKNDIKWVGIDINREFVNRALKQGHEAIHADIGSLGKLPDAEICLIMGSLYHFMDKLEPLFSKIFESSDKIIISEPISNLSQNNGIIGKLAKRSADVNGNKFINRFNKVTLLSSLDKLNSRLGLKYKILKEAGKDIIILIEKRG